MGQGRIFYHDKPHNRNAAQGVRPARFPSSAHFAEQLFLILYRLVQEDTSWMN